MKIIFVLVLLLFCGCSNGNTEAINVSDISQSVSPTLTSTPSPTPSPSVDQESVLFEEIRKLSITNPLSYDMRYRSGKYIDDYPNGEHIDKVKEYYNKSNDFVEDMEDYKAELDKKIEHPDPVIKFTNLTVSEPNSVGGVNVDFSFDNVSDKTIKYVRMLPYAYNAVDDRVGCDVYGFEERHLKYTGPLESECNSDENYFECVWYNSSITYLKLAVVEVEFMDGETIIYRNEKEISKLFYE